MFKGRIFGIGLAKTGTTSLTKALTSMGICAYHAECDILNASNGFLYVNQNHSAMLNCQAVVGTPMCANIEKLNNDYPDSKFIVTTRNIDKWIKSCEFHLSGLPIDQHHKMLHYLLYSTTLSFNREKFLEGYRVYHTYIRSTFQGDFLTIDINKPDIEKWSLLCNFLDISDFNIYQPFPRENVRAEKC